MALRTDYKDDILDLTQNTQRKYKMITNDDGTVSFVDMTVYSQVGDSFGAAQLNEIANVVNEGGSNMYYDPITDIKYLKNQDGEWVPVGYGGLQNVYLYKDGQVNSDLVGTFKLSSNMPSDRNTITFNENTLDIQYNNNGAGYATGGFETEKSIDVTNINRIAIIYNITSTATLSTNIKIGLCATNNVAFSTTYTTEVIMLPAGETTASGTLYLDTSSLSGNYYLCSSYRDNKVVTIDTSISEILMEKIRG